MKEDYLWSKTGHDPEIEKLEDALRIFRYAETAPPALPAKIVPFEKKARHNFFRLSFAFAACAVLVIFSFGIWRQISSEKIVFTENLQESIAPQINKKNNNEISSEKQADVAVRKIEIIKQPVGQKFVKARKNVATIARQNKFVAQKTEFKKPALKFTEEEKYAYNQLMLALSITSSKLKLVEEKIYGEDESKNVIENGR